MNNYDRILTRRGTEEQWLLADPILQIGEEAYVTDKRMSKHGDGISKFSELEYDLSEDRTYTSDIPVTDNIGDFNAGDIVNEKYNVIIDKLLHPYVLPEVSIKSNNNEENHSINSEVNCELTIKVIEKSESVTSVDLYTIEDGINVLIETLTNPSSEEIDNSTKYKIKTFTTNYIAKHKNGSPEYFERMIFVKISDSKNEVMSNIIKYNFIAPSYIGTVPNSTSGFSSDIIDNFQEVISYKKDIDISYSGEGRYAIAIPCEYGQLSKIVDDNGFNITSSFEMETVVYNSISYYMYIINESLYGLNNFTVTCKY